MTREQMIEQLVAANGGEILFRPSSISRVIHCHGSTQLIAKAPKERKSSFAAREGTAAHAVAEDCLRHNRTPEEWVGRKIKTHDDPDGFYVDEEMGEKIPDYLAAIDDRREPGVQVLIEQKLSLSALDPNEPLFAQNKGTADCVIVNPAKRKLTIVDLKWGKGVMVAGDSPQLKDYALLGLLTYEMPGGWAEVETVVVQPRAFAEHERIKAFTFRPEDILVDFIGLLVGSMDAALQPNAALTPDPTGGWCRWCPAKTICPALRDSAINIARDPFYPPPRMDAGTALTAIPNDILIGEVIEPVPPGALVLPNAVDLDPGEIATILTRRPLWETFISGVEQRAVQLLEAGINIPGWKLVQRTGNRRWKDADPDALATALRGMGLKPTEMYTDPKLRSPAQIEKFLPKKDRDKINPYVERPLGSATLVSGSDDRPALESALGPIDA